MTIGRSGNRSNSARQCLAKARRRFESRKILLESLESRELMAAGPQLISIQPNEGDLIREGQILHVSPNELVFRFDDSTTIDSATIYNSIQVSRSSGDGVFDRAYVSSDLGTNGAVVIDFAAATPGQTGNGIQAIFSKASRTDSRLPILTISGNSVNIEVNINPALKTTAQDLLTAFRNSPSASAKMLVTRLRGSEFTVIADTVPVGQPLILTGANTAKASSNLNAGSSIQVEFLAAQAGPVGLQTRLVVSQRDFGGIGLPIVSVSGQTVTVQLNSNARFATTLGEFINAINGNASANSLLQARIISGSTATAIGTIPINYSPIALTGVNDTFIKPAYIGVGDTGREVILRFAEALPDDSYRIDILGRGSLALKNSAGQSYNGGVDTSVGFVLDLGAKIESIVPQPITRGANGVLSQALDTIHVYFNADKLNIAEAEDERFYQLRYTSSSATTRDDRVVYPRQATYNAVAGRVELKFSRDLNQYFNTAGGQGAFRLRIGSKEGSESILGFNSPIPNGPGIDTTIPLAASAPLVLPTITTDPGSRFDTATNLTATWTPNSNGPSSVVLNSEIKNVTAYSLDFPGADSEPGNRRNRYQQHVTRVDTDGIEILEYNFQGLLGTVNGSVQLNAITDEQKELVRRILSLYENYLGVRFIETTSRGFIVATGDLRAINPSLINGVGFPFLVTGNLFSNGQAATIIDIQDFNSANQNRFGSDLFRNFARGIGNLLGLGSADELPGLTVQSNTQPVNPGIDTELVFPGNADIVHGQYAHRPEGKDIDLYRFSLPVAGQLKIEITAERLNDSSPLDGALRLYQRSATGWQEIAVNDDYFSQDASIGLDLSAGEYMVGVSAKGNLNYDPNIEDSGLGGRSEGKYQLRMDFRPPELSLMHDQTGTIIDGDSDGRPGGIFDYWFIPNDPASTVYVDKMSPGTGTGSGSLVSPYRNISSALTASAALLASNVAYPTSGNVTTGQVFKSQVGDAYRVLRNGTLSGPIALAESDRIIADIASGLVVKVNVVVRIVGNGGTDGLIQTTADNLPYEIGFNRLGQAQVDGSMFDVPKNVTVMVDAGAILKLTRARIGVGSTTISVDRSGGALQVIGIPRFIDNATGKVIVDASNEPIPGSVYFTALNDASFRRGSNLDSNPPAAVPGDWGGIDFRNRIDASLSSAKRPDFETNGLFLNSVVHADIRYGGGQVVVDGVSQVITPVHLVDARTTIANSLISRSADAAISATPNSFKESNFLDPQSQAAGAFIADFERVGPEIHGNLLSNNTVNGLFIRTRTPAASTTEVLTVAGRFDDLDIVHVISENLIVQGSAGGALAKLIPPVSSTVALQPSTLQGMTNGLTTGAYRYRFAFIENGQVGPASSPSPSVNVTTTIGVNDGQVRLTALPAFPSSQRLAIYRTTVTNNVDGVYRLVGSIGSNESGFIDQLATPGATLPIAPNTLVSSPSLSSTFVSLAIPGLSNGLVAGTYTYQFRYVSPDGSESASTQASGNIDVFTSALQANGRVDINNLPTIISGKLRIFRSLVVAGVPTGYVMVGEVNGTTRNFSDTNVPFRLLPPTSPLLASEVVPPVMSSPGGLTTSFTPSFGPAGLLPAAVYQYQFSFAVSDGGESTLSSVQFGGAPVQTTVLAGQNQLTISNLPAIPIGQTLRIYRSTVTALGQPILELVGIVSPGSPTFTDQNQTLSLLPAPVPDPAVAAPPSTVTLAASPSATLTNALTAGSYAYLFSLVSTVTPVGESVAVPLAGAFASTTVVVTTTNGVANGQVLIGNLPVIPAGQSLRIYRATVVNGQAAEFNLLSTVSGSTTTYLDVAGTPGELLDDSRTGPLQARTNGSLVVDPGAVLKFQSSRIEVQNGGQFLAEGSVAQPIIMTSVNDKRYGAGGTFDTSNRGVNAVASEGNWGGLYVGQGSSGSLDYVRLSYGGGTTRIEGGFASFNAIEVHQAEFRIAHSRLENNDSGVEAGTTIDRVGRGTNFTGTVFVRGSQPIIVENRITDNLGAAINIDADSLNSEYINDKGRSTGFIKTVGTFLENQGALIDGNRVDGNAINGMVVRGQTLTTESVWDDADIVHVVLDEVVASNLHTYGGLKLVSKESQSLVVKLDGNNTGLTATGLPLDLEDRIGGSVSLIGAPNAPIVLTSIYDCTVGAGFTTDGLPQTETLFDPVTKQSVCTAPVASPPTIALLDADVIVVMDESGSMAQQQAFTTQLIAQLELSFTAKGIGSTGGNRYGLVGYGSDANPVHTIPVGGANAPFGTALQYVVAANANLVQAGGIEDGWAAVYYAITNYTYRPNAAKFMILVTDEDRDVDSRITFNPTVTLSRAGLITQLQANGIKLEGILNTRIVDPIKPALALAADSTVYTSAINGGFTTKLGGRLDTSFGTTQTDYVDIIHPVGGIVGDLGFISPGGNDTTSFANALVSSIVQQVTPPVVAPVGDWRGLLFETNSSDRNIAPIVENESPRSNEIGRNDLPSNSQYIGILSNRPSSGDENARLGFQIQGVINKPSDRDVYSFNAVGGTEVWLDIDRTQNNFDSVVELVDSNGRILALSDNSVDEELNSSLLYRSDLPISNVNALRKSSRDLFPSDSRSQPKDLYSTNNKDAGMRVVLPGPNDRTSLYHIRVRSSNAVGLDDASRISRLIDPMAVDQGRSKGAYQLQVRLTEADEFPGSSVSFADIRFATTGIDLAGVPRHSPLLGETAEQPDTIDITLTPPLVTNPNDSVFTAQELGNLLTTDRATLSLAGRLASPTDVDWYAFSIDYTLLDTQLAEYFSTVLDIDYADGVGRPDTSLYLYRDLTIPGQPSNIRLVSSGLNSNILDDRAGALRGADNTDLGRGSAGTLDPFIGSTELQAGRYYVAVTSQGMIPRSLLSYTNGANGNLLLRSQPSNNSQWIVEDRVEIQSGTSAVAPIVPNFVPAGSAVPFTFGDIPLYLSRDLGASSNILIANPKTGTITNAIGGTGEDFQDIAFRYNGDLRGFNSLQSANGGGDRDNLINYYQIDDGTAAVSQIGQSNIQTRDIDLANGQLEDADVAIEFNAITFANFGAEVGIAVGNRGSNTAASLNGIHATRPAGAQGTNVIYRFDPTTGQALLGGNLFNIVTNPIGNVNPPDIILGNGTDIQERGYIETNPLPTALSTSLLFPEATQVTGLTTTNLINDGDIFRIRTAAVNATFEFNSGPQINLNLNPDLGPYFLDGDQFTMDGTVYEIQTNGTPVTAGAVAVNYQNSFTNSDFAAELRLRVPATVSVGLDGRRINFSGAVNIAPLTASISRVMTVSGNGQVNPGFVGVNFLASDTADEIAKKATDAINNLGLVGLSASQNGRRVSIVGGDVIAVTGGIRREGIAPGGTITGVAAFSNGTLFAVSDTGGLFAVNNSFAATETFNQVGSYVATSTDLIGLRFSGLTVGPQHVEGGRYANLLFASTIDGMIVAFNTRGELQNVFAGGANRVSTGQFGITGLAFSTLDYNLWHISSNRSAEAGHGRVATPDGVVPAALGQQSWYFGFENSVANGVSLPGASSPIAPENLPNPANPRFGNALVRNTFNFPGGALGVLESQPISLESVSQADSPYFYFNYNSTIENVLVSDVFSRDVLRVQVMGDNGIWSTVAINDVRTTSQNIFNNSATLASWRQARIDLSPFVGNKEVRFRFEFSSGNGLGSFRGPELRAVPGASLNDGQTFILSGQVFELDSGASLLAPEGALIANNTVVQVAGTTFTFYDGTGPLPSGFVVRYNRSQSASQVALALANAVNQALLPIPGSLALLSGAVDGNRVQFSASVNVTASGNFSVIGGTGVGKGRIAVPFTRFMTAAQVAASLQSVLEATLATAQTVPATLPATGIYPRNGQYVTLTGLTVDNPGPFTFTNSTANNNLRSINNDVEGIYLDDFVIGFAERGEIVNDLSNDTTLVPNPNSRGGSINVGPYQLEIRGGEDYLLPGATSLSYAVGFSANDRLSSGAIVSLTSSDNLVDGDYIDVSDGIRSLRFVFKNSSLNTPLGPSEFAVLFKTSVVDLSTNVVTPESGAVVASRLRDLINSPAIQAQLNVTAISVNGSTSGIGGDSIALTSNAIVNPLDVSPRTPIATVQVSRRHGDSNTKREQGQVVVENSKISDSTGFGIRLRADDRTLGTQNPNPGSTRNTIVLNSERIAPGAVIINNELVGNKVGGIAIVGDIAANTSSPAAIPFARIVNNTIVGGTFSNVVTPEVFVDPTTRVTFTSGTRSFTDDVVSYLPRFSGGLAPTSGYEIPTNALGAPNYNPNKIDIADRGIVSLGNGGRLTVSFTNNVLTLSGDSSPDLAVFVVGTIERVRVEVSRDNVSYIAVGEVNGITHSIDLDAIFGPSFNIQTDGFRYVRLTDVFNEGATTGIDVGADIDAVGAISTRYSPVDYVPSGTGISVGANASPTLLNNIVVNTNVAIDIDATSLSTVIGGALYQQNTLNTQVAGKAQVIGKFPTVVDNEVNLFLDPVGHLYYPRATSLAIDAAIDSLQDRDGLVAVKQPLGLSPSPILAPTYDINGLLRVDDPNVATPTGRGEDVFKDIGAQDRSDSIGPAVVLASPGDNDAEGIDRNLVIGTVELRNSTLSHFDLRLIDSGSPIVSATGIGINASSVLSPVVRLYENNKRLVDGIDYRFGYDASGGVIRLTPLSGVWRTESNYNIRFLESDQFVIPMKSVLDMQDGATYTISTANSNVSGGVAKYKFELDLGYRLVVPTVSGSTAVKILDGEYFDLNDGLQTVRFEFDNDGSTTPNSIAIPFLFSDNSQVVAGKIVTAIRSAGMSLNANYLGGDSVQIIGNVVTLTNTITDIVTGNTVNTTGLTIIGANGIDRFAGATRVPIDASVLGDIESIASQLTNAILGANIPGLSVNTFGRNVEIDNAIDVTAIRADVVHSVQDRAGNPIQANQIDGTTQLFVSFIDGFDYGDAPDPSYASSKASNGPRHRAKDGFFLGSSVSVEADAPLSNGDFDDGIVIGDITQGYSSQVTVTAAGISVSQPGYLSAWIDFNGNGTFENSELITTSSNDRLFNGNNVINFVVPGSARSGVTFGRFRYSSTRSLTPIGEAADGEVEDWSINILGNSYTNQTNYLDVNQDGSISPIDALQVINYLARKGSSSVQLVTPRPEGAVKPFIDVDGDGYASPIDVLLVINAINRQSRGAGGEGEGASFQNTSTWTPASQVDASSVPAIGPGSAPSTASISTPSIVERKAGSDASPSSDLGVHRFVPSQDAVWASVVDEKGSLETDWIDDSELVEIRQKNEVSNRSRSLHDSVFADLEGFELS